VRILFRVANARTLVACAGGIFSVSLALSSLASRPACHAAQIDMQSGRSKLPATDTRD